MTLIKGGLVITMNGKKSIARMSILIDGEKIVGLFPEEAERNINPGEDLPAEWKEKADGNLEIIDAEGKIILPGFVNGHIHADMLLCRGLGDGLTLHEQAGDSLPGRNRWFRKQMTRESRHIARIIQYMEALRSGTTFICDFLFWAEEGDNICSAFQSTGMDGAVVIDYRNDFLHQERRNPAQLKRIFQHILGGGYKPMLQGPAEEDYDTNVLLDLVSIAREEKVKIMLHLAETRTRKDMSVKRFGKTPVSYLDEIGFLGPDIIGSHGVYISFEEAGRLADSGTTIVSSPVAEMKISDGVAPVRMLLDRSVPVGLGTDGALWNDSANMFGEMKALMLIQRLVNGASSLSCYEALEAATIGGARAIGMEREIGSIEEGKKASIFIIDPNRVNLVPVFVGRNSNVVENIVSSAQPADIETVFVNGKKVIEKGEFTLNDERDAIRQAQRLGEKLFANLI